MTNGTIVSGTQVNYHPGSNVNTPYDVITAGSLRQAASLIVESPCISGINPDHETWIRKTMLNDWGICHPHKFQIHAIHQATFYRDELVYIIAKTGLGKSAISLTVGLFVVAEGCVAAERGMVIKHGIVAEQGIAAKRGSVAE